MKFVSKYEDETYYIDSPSLSTAANIAQAISNEPIRSTIVINVGSITREIVPASNHHETTFLLHVFPEFVTHQNGKTYGLLREVAVFWDNQYDYDNVEDMRHDLLSICGISLDDIPIYQGTDRPQRVVNESGIIIPQKWELLTNGLAVKINIIHHRGKTKKHFVRWILA